MIGDTTQETDATVGRTGDDTLGWTVEVVA
jgi:hypothetical protein